MLDGMKGQYVLTANQQIKALYLKKIDTIAIPVTLHFQLQLAPYSTKQKWIYRNGFLQLP